MNLKMDVDKVKRWRQERSWSQEHLAELAGIGLRTVQRAEYGDPVSQETLMALAAAFNVDPFAIVIDPASEEKRALQRKNERTRDALRLSLWIHLAGYAMGVVVFTGISLGMRTGEFVMLWPLIWWTVGVTGHIVTVVIVELVTRFNERW